MMRCTIFAQSLMKSDNYYGTSKKAADIISVQVVVKPDMRNYVTRNYDKMNRKAVNMIFTQSVMKTYTR